MHAIEPILFDIKDGTLKRVSKSNFDPSKSKIMPPSGDIFANEKKEDDHQQRSSEEEEEEENNDTAKFNNRQSGRDDRECGEAEQLKDHEICGEQKRKR